MKRDGGRSLDSFRLPEVGYQDSQVVVSSRFDEEGTASSLLM